jgi:protein-disulfide isomerase
VASRKQQKEEARAQREQVHARQKAEQSRRTRLTALGGVLAAVVIVAAVFIISSSKSGAGHKTNGLSGIVSHFKTNAQAVADMQGLLKGIPQSGNTLGDPAAPVTITEYGDLVCSTCDYFALTSEPQLIKSEIATGHAKLVFRGTESASSTANGSEYVNTQVAARAAGLQNLGWSYIMLMYNEQPVSVNGKSSELASYITTGYLQDIAQQVPGLNLAKWQQNLTNSTLIADVHADGVAADQAGVQGTPTIFATGPKGTVEYDKDGTEPSVVPTLAQLQAMIAQVS